MKQYFEWKQATPDNLPKDGESVITQWISNDIRWYAEQTRRDLLYKLGNPGVSEIKYLSPASPLPISGDVQKFNPYGKHEQEQSVGSFIHEHNRGLSSLHWTHRDLTDWIIKNGETLKSAGLVPEELFKIADSIKRSKSALTKYMDDYIVRWKTFNVPIAGHQARDGEVEKLVEALKKIEKLEREMGVNPSRLITKAALIAIAALKPYQSPVKETI